MSITWEHSVLLSLKIFFSLLQIFVGNVDSSSIQYHNLAIPVVTRSVTVNPTTWEKNIGLRMELYGCMPGLLSLNNFTFPLLLLVKERDKTNLLHVKSTKGRRHSYYMLLFVTLHEKTSLDSFPCNYFVTLRRSIDETTTINFVPCSFIFRPSYSGSSIACK